MCSAWVSRAEADQKKSIEEYWLARAITLLWMFTGVVFVALYTAQLTATLTVRQIRGPINGPEDLPGKTVGTIKGTVSARYLREHNATVVELQHVEDMYHATLARATILEDPMKPGCTLNAFLHAKPEKRDELLKVLQSFVKPSRAEPAFVEYHLHVSNDDPNLFVFYENWRTRKELDQHLRTPILTNFWSQRLELLQKDVEIQFITMLSDLD